jgi:hypothetical protein
MTERKHSWTGAGSFLTALARDVRANTMAIMAMALIPLAGMVGGGIDISRMYIVKTRLQHACDAGALAGRKAMAGGTWAQTVKINNVDVPNYPKVAAEDFFDANFNTGAYGLISQSDAQTRAFTENAGKVSGTASVQIPMTLMRIFGRTTETLAVTCEADMRLPNTDIMFVLDNTGSMDCKPDGSSCGSAGTASKMAGLRVAVKCFYEIVARLDTDAACTTGTPSGGTGAETQIRFGFVPYSMNVNVGKLLPNNYFPDTWHYQTRQANWNPPGSTANGPYWEIYSGGSISQSDCLKFMSNQAFLGFTPTATSSGTAPAPTVEVTFPSDGAATAGGGGEWGWTNASDTSGSSRSCRRLRTDTTTTHVPTFKDWTYGQLDVNISGLKAGGSNWNNSFTLPVGDNGAAKTINWNGCIEERDTVKSASYSPIPSGAYDLDLDSAPTSALATQWKPALPDLVWYRQVTNSWSQANTAQVTTTTNFYNTVNAGCPTAAKKLQAWPDATAFDNYVDSLQPVGNTYHDIGMIWGGRLMSPTGIWASENALTPKGGEIERHLIFMTDGIAQANPCDYSAYGIAWFEPRTNDNVGSASACANENSNLDTEINNRLAGLCTAIKNKNITLWVIAFGSGVDTATKTRLQTCASPNRYYDAGNSAALQQTFASIANQISALRLTN